MPPLSHSSVSASSCERWWNCPGSVGLNAKLPPANPTKYAAEGTAAHALCEKYLYNKVHYKCKWDATYEIGETYEADDFKFKVTEEMAAAANLYVDTIMEDIKRIGCTLKKTVELKGKDSWKHWDAETQNSVYVNWVNIEKNFELKDVDSEARGTNDASIFVPGETLIVYDFKYGAGIPVEAEENKQMLYYAIGAAGDKLMDYKTIELVIVQPRAEHPLGPVRRWVTTPEYVAQFKQELKERIADTRNPNAKTCTGTWCRFCNAKLICPSMRDKTYELAKVDFAKVENTSIPAPETLTKEQIKLFLDNADLLENYISAVREYAFNLVNRGETIEGYKLVKSGKTHRKWKDEDENIVAEMLALELGVNKDSLFETKLKTPAQVEKLVKGSKDIVGSYSFKPEGALKLVKESNIKESQKPTAIADFQLETAIADLGL